MSERPAQPWETFWIAHLRTHEATCAELNDSQPEPARRCFSCKATKSLSSFPEPKRIPKGIKNDICISCIREL